MKVIPYILVFVFVTSILHAETPRWTTIDDLQSWLRSKQKLEIQEYKDVGKSIEDWHNGKYLDDNKYSELWTINDKLAFKRFEELMDARDDAGASEYFEEVGPLFNLKLDMMNALADCKDVEFSARVVHHALGRPNWVYYGRGFSLPHTESKWKLIKKVLRLEPLDKVPREYDGDSLDEQNVMKEALVKKWPKLLEETAKVPKNTTPHKQVAQVPADRPDSQKQTSSQKWPWMIGGLILAVILGVFGLFRKTLRRTQS